MGSGLGPLFAGAFGQLGEDVERARVEDRVHRVEAQAVQVELPRPRARVLREVPADTRAVGAVEIHGGAPRRLIAVGEIRPVLGKVVPFGTEMVVDHVEDHRQAAGMAGVDEPSKAPRAPVGGLGRVEMHAVVAPVPRAGKFGDRHQLDRGDPQIDQPREIGNDGFEGPRARVGPHVQLVEDEIRTVVTAKPGIGPGEPGGIDHRGRPVHALGLPARHGVRAVTLAIEAVLIAGAVRHHG
jgi:hypothetical protein